MMDPLEFESAEGVHGRLLEGYDTARDVGLEEIAKINMMRGRDDELPWFLGVCPWRKDAFWLQHAEDIVARDTPRIGMSFRGGSSA